MRKTNNKPGTPTNYGKFNQLHPHAAKIRFSALFLFVVFAAAQWIGGCTASSSKPQPSSSQPSSQPSPQLSVTPAQLSFGDVILGSKSAQNVLLSNTGATDLTLSQATVSGSGFTVSGLQLPLTVMAGKSASLTVSFAPNASSAATGSLTLVSNAPNSPTTIALSAKGADHSSAQLSVVPSTISFGAVTVGITNTQTVTVSNPGSASLSVSQATVSGSGFALKGLTLPLTVAPGSSASFTVSFSPTASGNATGSLTLVSNAPTSPTTVALSGTGSTASVQLTASPSSLSFGNVGLGSTASKTVTLSNAGNSSLSISQLSASGAGFSASGLTVPLTLSPGQSTSFSVHFAPSNAGSVTGTVSVTSNASNSPAQIALSGNGLQPSTPTGPLAAFPGAQGGGALTVGGRGGAVYEVTNLNDTGAGSLRACVEASGPRTCVFRTGGHLTLHSQLYIGNPFLTIAGQTAPGGGIELSAKDPNGTAYFSDDLIRIETHDVILRYVKFRLGYNASASYQNTMVIQAASQYNIMVDHCSLYWGMWDDISVYATNAGSNKNITFSWNIIAEPLLQPGASGTVATNVSGANSTIADASTDMDFHHNLFASSDHRTPLHTVRSGRLVNNIVYNWSYYGLRTKGAKDIIGNFFKPGPMNLSPGHEIETWTTNDGNDTSYAPSLYVTGNAGPHNSYNPSTDNWSTLTALACNESASECSSPLSSTYQRSTPLATSGVPITADSATSLATSGGTFLSTVGASQKLNDSACDGSFISNQDSVDTRVLNEFLNGTGTSNPALQYESQVGGFPSLTQGTACADTGHDGMTDVWELAHGLTPGDPANATKVAPNGFTYLENYLNATDPNVAVTY